MAGSLAVFGLALANPASAADVVTVERLAGATRYGTAAAIAGDEAFAAPTTAIVASGETANLADALAASTLAGANAPAPIVLTQNATYSAETKAALAGLRTKGVRSVTIVGGTAAVAESVATAIAADGFTVTRVAGTDRFATAAAIANAANRIAPADLVDNLDTAFVASGTSFADALAGSPAAASGGIPLLLVNADSIPAATSAAMTDLGIKKVVILGGTVPVSENVASQIAAATGNPVTRLAGTNRYGTAAAIGEYEIDTLGFAATSAILANGVSLVDALTGGPLGGILEAPIVLTDPNTLPAESAAFLDAHSDTITKLYVLGGTAAISDATVTAAVTAAQTTANDPDIAGASQTSALVGPELQSVAITDVDTDFDVLEIEYTFTFDSDVDEDELDAGAFHLYDADTTNRVSGTEAESDGPSVAVTFDLTEDGAGTAALAAVETGAVVDDDGNENPPQSVTINVLSNSGQPGADLVDINVADEDEGDFTFTFNSNIYPEALALGGYSFNVVTETGVVESVNSADATNVATDPDDDDPSTTVLVTFPDLADDESALTEGTDDVVRGYVTFLANGVIQNVDIRGGGDVDGGTATTAFPDLESVELPTSNSDLSDDEVLFTFDEVIDTASAAAFRLYYGVDGSGTVAGTATEIDEDEVTVTFTEEAVNQFVAGASVLAGAVATDGDDVEAEGAAATAPNPNRADGELENYTATRGDVAGPQVTDVDFVTDLDSFGDFNEYQITFTFDRDLVEGDDLSGFSVFSDEDGETVQTDLDNCDTDDNTVVCTDDDEDSDVEGALVAAVDYDSVRSDDEFNVGNGVETFPNPEASFAVSNAAETTTP